MDKGLLARPKVSVIIPSYNHRAYIGDAIRSVLDQERKNYELELIVIDDGSTDGSVEFISEVKKATSSDFKFIAKSNEGLCKTLNRAIREHAQGDYIAILASDDLWVSNKIELQLECFEKNPNCLLSYCNAIVFGQNTIEGRAQRFQFKGNVKNWLTVYNFVPAGTVMYRSELFNLVDGYDENGLKLEDWDFLLRAASVTHFCFLKDPLLLYRIHGDSTMARMRANGTLFSEKLKVLGKNREILNPVLRTLSIALHRLHGMLARSVVVLKRKANSI